MTTLRVRLGVVIPFFPNAMIAIVYIDQKTFNSVNTALQVVKMVLENAGRHDIATALVCEKS